MYKKRIQREFPTSFIFVLDQSSSMAEPFGAGVGSKAGAVAAALNRLIQNLIDVATKDDGVRHYYDIAVVGYGASVGPILHGSQPGAEFVSVRDVADKPLKILDRPRKVSDGVGGIVEEMTKVVTWVEPVANGRTPMYEAFEQALVLVEQGARRYPDSYPPTVIHITDGAYTSADPAPLMTRLKQVSTSDGNALLFNIHISSKIGSVFLPSSAAELSDDYARMLFEGASVLPQVCIDAARVEKLVVDEASRGFAFNADPVQLVQFLNVGTSRTSNTRSTSSEDVAA